MTSQRDREELINNLESLGPCEVRQILNLARTLHYCEIHGIQPPDPDYWRSTPDWLRWKIFFELLWVMAQVNFARFMWRIGLRLAGGRWS